jgi:hypothetical protein
LVTNAVQPAESAGAALREVGLVAGGEGKIARPIRHHEHLEQRQARRGHLAVSGRHLFEG